MKLRPGAIDRVTFGEGVQEVSETLQWKKEIMQDTIFDSVNCFKKWDFG